MARLRVAGLGFALLLSLTSPAHADEGKDESGKGHRGHASVHTHSHVTVQRGGGRSWFHEHGYEELDIPPGHYPPPGECRVWYPDRPPGHQPPPGSCHARVPRGAWLIRHPEDAPDHVHVVVYEPDRPGQVLVTGEFDIDSGTFVRVVLR